MFGPIISHETSCFLAAKPHFYPAVSAACMGGLEFLFFRKRLWRPLMRNRLGFFLS